MAGRYNQGIAFTDWGNNKENQKTNILQIFKGFQPTRIIVPVDYTVKIIVSSNGKSMFTYVNICCCEGLSLKENAISCQY